MARYFETGGVYRLYWVWDPPDNNHWVHKDTLKFAERSRYKDPDALYRPKDITDEVMRRLDAYIDEGL